METSRQYFNRQFRGRLKRYNPLGTAWVLAVAVLLFLPALLFSHLMPDWAPLVALMGLLIIFLLRVIAVGQIHYAPTDGLVALLLLILAMGQWGHPEANLAYLYAFIANLALFWVIAAQRDAAWLRQSGWLLLLAGLLLGGIVLLGTRFSTAKFSFINQGIYQALPGGWRAFWDQDSFNSNIAGGLVALFLLPAIVLIWRGVNWQQRDVAKFIAMFLSVLLLLTQSRGALLATLIALLVVTLLMNRRWLGFWMLVLVVVGVTVSQLGLSSTLELISTPRAGGLQSRQELWFRTLYLIQIFPIAGVGVGMVAAAMQQYPPPALLYAMPKASHAHSIYLQAGAELGLPGLLMMLALFFTMFRLLLKQSYNPQAGLYRGLALGLLGSLIIFLVHGLFDAITSSPQVALMVWGLFGLMVAVATSTDPQAVPRVLPSGSDTPAIDGSRLLFKRLFDLMLSALLLLLLAPLMAAIALLIKLDTPGPIFFKQQRVGQGGHLFWMVKFRSMIDGAEQYEAQILRQAAAEQLYYIKTPQDVRITRLGRLLRRTSLDELPQLFNVFKGEMSLVGPRPELPWLTDPDDPRQQQRLIVPQGMTGWWQVNGRMARASLQQRLEDDLFYIKNYSFWLDLRILGKTIRAVIRGEGAY